VKAYVDVAEEQHPSSEDNTEEEHSESGDLDKDKGAVAEDQAPSSEDKTEEDHSEGGGLDEDEDEAAEDDAEEEPDTPPNFTPNGPSLDVRDVAPETDYTIRVGDNERTYTTDSHGSAGINIVDDFELPPGSHQVTITGPDGHKQEVTFYATGMQVENTRVNVLGLDPSATYQLSVNGRIAQVGVFDFTPLPDGTFTLDINQQFPHALPGWHEVSLSGGGYS